MKVKKVVNCPVCGKEVKFQGLASHLRVAHGKVDISDKRGEILAAAKPGPKSLATRVLDLVDELEKIRSKKAKLEEIDKSGFFFTDEAVESLKKGLDKLEKELLRELKELDVVKEEADDDKEEADDDEEEDFSPFFGLTQETKD